MSLLNQLFNRGVFGSKCKTCLNLSISRIKLQQNKRDMQLKHMKKEIAQFLQAGQEPIARIRVEHVIRELNLWAAYEILELFCEFILARVPILEAQTECPRELREAIASIVFAAPRCSEVPDLIQIRNMFGTKYGKDFILAASELRPDSGVNRTIIEKLSPIAPSGEVKLKVLKDIAKEHNVYWDSSATEAEFKKNHEDLLGGSKHVSHEASDYEEKSFESSVSDELPAETRRRLQQLQTQNHGSHMADSTTGVVQTQSDVMERARVAIASAERATAKARAAAQLVNASYVSSMVEEGKPLTYQ